MTELTTTFMGMKLAHPLVASSSPLTGSIDTLLALEAAGAAAVVLPSLFEEQIEHEERAFLHGITIGGDFNVEAPAGYFPVLGNHESPVERHLDLLTRAKSELAVPVIASLNGTSDGGWSDYAMAFEDRGADALELNVYLISADADVSGADVEACYLRLVENVRSSVDIPLAVKIGPQFSSPAHMARRLTDAGADGLVLFNRFYQPDIDLETLDVAPNLELSTSSDMRLTLRWIAIMSGQVNADLGATTGVHAPADVVKLILAGADVTMMTSALLRHGPAHLTAVLAGVERWFTDRDYESLDQARGSVSQTSIPDPVAFERANYMKALTSYTPDN